MEIFNESGQFLSSVVYDVFEAALNKTTIKTQAIKLAQQHVAHKLQIALDAQVITSGSVKVTGMELLVEMEYPPTVTTAKDPNGSDITINATQKVSKVCSMEDTLTKRTQLAMLNSLDGNSIRH